MTNRSEKENRKEILRQLKEKEKEKAGFNKSLRMSNKFFNELFDYLDKRLGEGCDHSMSKALGFLKEREIQNVDKIIDWLIGKGGYCDCEY